MTNRSTRKAIYRELAGLTTKTLLLSLFDISALFGALDPRPYYARTYQSYLKERVKDYQQFYRLIHRLKIAKLIDVYSEGKEKFITLTDEGRKRVVKYLFEDGKVPIPSQWDGKWRVIIFDIPEDLNVIRNILRDLLKRVGFLQLQKSVYVYPHDCTTLVKYIEEIYGIDQYLQFIIAERIETEVDLITVFAERGIIRDIKKIKNKTRG